MNKYTISLLFVFTYLSGGLTYAHQNSTSFLSINVLSNSTTDYAVEWRAQLIDLEVAVGLDIDQDGKITWGEVLSRHPEIAVYAQSRISFQQSGQACNTEYLAPQIEDPLQKIYLVQTILLSCPLQGSLDVNYTALLDVNREHRGIIQFASDDSQFIDIASHEQSEFQFQLSANSELRSFTGFVISGMEHIAIGYDHLLFLLALLLPSVLLSHQGRWRIQTEFKPVALDVLTIVTCFTITHSISLLAASLHWLNPPPSRVETAIAASVVVAGILLFFPTFHRYRWLLALLFGFIHGFGFAGILRELSLSTDSFWLGVIGFNLGIEIGQIAIVVLLLPLLYFSRKQFWYRRYCIPTGAFCLIVTGSLWALERM